LNEDGGFGAEVFGDGAMRFAMGKPLLSSLFTDREGVSLLLGEPIELLFPVRCHDVDPPVEVQRLQWRVGVVVGV